MAYKIINHLVVDVRKTIGDKLLLLEVRPYAKYIEGIRGEQEGVTITVLSEFMCFEKVDVKIAGLKELPFAFDGTPIPIEFEGLEAKVWQDWNNRGEVKLSISATGISPLTGKQIKMEGGNRA